MSEYKPKCDVCPHYNSCTVQKALKMLYEERFNRSRELAGRTDGFVDGMYVKDALKGADDERVMEICGDNRFEIIAKAKEHLLDATNIDTSEDEMKVLDSFLYRCWQMGWLDRYAEQTEPCDECIFVKGSGWCDNCNGKPKGLDALPNSRRAEQTEPMIYPQVDGITPSLIQTEPKGEE